MSSDKLAEFLDPVDQPTPMVRLVVVSTAGVGKRAERDATVADIRAQLDAMTEEQRESLGLNDAPAWVPQKVDAARAERDRAEHFLRERDAALERQKRLEELFKRAARGAHAADEISERDRLRATVEAWRPVVEAADRVPHRIGDIACGSNGVPMEGLNHRLDELKRAIGALPPGQRP